MELEICNKFENMCRACMTICNQTALRSLYVSINDHQNQKVLILELLENAIQKLPRIERTDELPKSICDSCLDKLSACYEFQQCCLSSDEHLRKLITSNCMDIFSTNVAAILDPLQDGDNKHFNFPDVENFIKREEFESNLDAFSEAINDEHANVDTFENIETPDSDNSQFQTPHDIVTAEYENSTEIKQTLSCPTCKTCNKQFSNIKYLNRHKKRMHNDTEIDSEENEDSKKDNLYKCNECDSEFGKKSYLRKHKYRHKQPGGLKKTKKCDSCDMVFHTILALKKHCLMEHQEITTENNILDATKPYICEYCNKGFQQSCTLKDHKRIHTKETPFLCSHCGKAFNSNSNLQQHLLRHTGEKRYECPDCPKKFPCLSDLFSHKQVHKKLKPHVCDICGAAFGKPSQLKKHKMYHSGEKPYQCEYCEMRFVCADHMRRHMRTHTGEKPYKCKYCTRTFTQSNDMIKHLRLHLGVNVYQCELCPSAFRLAAELREHFALHKNDDDETREQNKRALMEAQEKLRHKLELDRAISVRENDQSM